MRANGMSFVELREAGRWVADTTLRTYLDVVGAALLETNRALQPLRGAIERAGNGLLSSFPEAALR